jgi:hypothetical protein
MNEDVPQPMVEWARGDDIHNVGLLIEKPPDACRASVRRHGIWSCGEASGEHSLVVGDWIASDAIDTSVNALPLTALNEPSDHSIRDQGESLVVRDEAQLVLGDRNQRPVIHPLQ